MHSETAHLKELESFLPSQFIDQVSYWQELITNFGERYAESREVSSKVVDVEDDDELTLGGFTLDGSSDFIEFGNESPTVERI